MSTYRKRIPYGMMSFVAVRRDDRYYVDKIVVVYRGMDMVDFEFASADYKVVTYIDSVGCTSCKLQLPYGYAFPDLFAGQG